MESVLPRPAKRPSRGNRRKLSGNMAAVEKSNDDKPTRRSGATASNRRSAGAPAQSTQRIADGAGNCPKRLASAGGRATAGNTLRQAAVNA
ncbi:hypothetical protein GCM10022405_30110 [Gibbsiella dentisursi]|uniref:Uncharacterized protein n=1 Tax=Gibbsiella dentisursi TaxID=796890 RepID=A0ABP7LMY5_9GAMM